MSVLEDNKVQMFLSWPERFITSLNMPTQKPALGKSKKQSKNIHSNQHLIPIWKDDRTDISTLSADQCLDSEFKKNFKIFLGVFTQTHISEALISNYKEC